MNQLSELNINPVIDTDDDVKSFYNDTLSVASEYKRVSAYLNNGIFKYILKGLKGLFQNGGRMKLILSSEVDPTTFQMLKEGYSLKFKSEEEKLEAFKIARFDLDSLPKNAPLIPYLIATGHLEVKMAIVEHGILHDKYGLIEDAFGNVLLFSGSNNETEAALEFNHESFETTYNWGNPSAKELAKIERRQRDFELLWSNRKESIVVLEIPQIVIEKTIDDIDYDQLKAEISDFYFIRILADNEGNIILKTNHSSAEIFDTFQFQSLKKFIKVIENKKIVFNRMLYMSDVEILEKTIRSIAEKLNKKLIRDSSYVSYLESKSLEMSRMSDLGFEIKKGGEILKSEEYSEFSNTVDRLLKRKLRDAQKRSAFHILKLRRSMNFSVPGSGKTSSVLGAFEYLRYHPNELERVERMLVFGPLNSFKAWKDEYRFVSQSYDQSKILDIKEMGDVGSKLTALKWDFNRSHLILVNFDVVPQLESVLASLVDSKTFIVFDEIHRVKKIDGPKYYSCLKIIESTKYRVALSGTPLPNGYLDIYNICGLIYGEYARNYFELYEDRLIKSDKNFIENGLEDVELNQKIYPFYMRITKADLQIPKANPDNLIQVVTNEKEKQLFSNIITKSKSTFGSFIDLLKIGCIPESVGKIRSDSVDIFMSESEDFDNELDVLSNEMTSKLSKLVSLLKENQRKAIVWCVFISSIKKVKRILEENGFKVEEIYGSVENSKRNEIIDKFNFTDEIDIIVANPATLAESVSLHYSCHDAYYLEMNLNLAQYLQSRDRIHRLGIGETTETNYYILINTYDEKSLDQQIYDRLKLKEQRMINSIEKGSFFYRQDIGKDVYQNEIDKLVSDLKSEGEK